MVNIILLYEIILIHFKFDIWLFKDFTFEQICVFNTKIYTLNYY